jgi:hypothetical protein
MRKKFFFFCVLCNSPTTCSLPPQNDKSRESTFQEIILWNNPRENNFEDFLLPPPAIPFEETIYSSCKWDIREKGPSSLLLSAIEKTKS